MVLAKLVALLTILAICQQLQHDSQALAMFNSSSDSNFLDCEEQIGVTSLGPRCRLFEVFKRRLWDRMPEVERLNLIRYCTCRLVNLDWEGEYDDHPAPRRVFIMIDGLIKFDKYKHQDPPQIWSDIDTIANGYSIYLSTREFFKRRGQDKSVAFFSDTDFEKQGHLRDIRYVCLKVAHDKSHYYQYLESLQRIDPFVFLRALEMNDMMNMVYQASKACKLFILHRFDEFKRKRASSEFHALDKVDLQAKDLEDLNQVHSGNDIDSSLRFISLKLFNCTHWRRNEINLEKLAIDCPMMMNDSLPSSWVEEHSEPGERSRVALECGCKLLALNSSWAELMEDADLGVMSKALTNYMGQNRPPAFRDPETSTRDFSAWFDRVMEKFATDKKVSIKEIIKNKYGSDPTNEINRRTGDEETALDQLRSGCNRLIFSHVKGSKKADAIRPIKYLDNLRYISQDPLFVFHLTLLDANLFKLHALSKMCRPVVS